MITVFELARQLKAPGVQTIATFNPARLSTTVRNMARKSIASGYHKGGWSSQTREVREIIFKVAGERPIVYVKQGADYMSFTSPRPITKDTLSEIVGLFEADCTLQKMGYADLNSNYRPAQSVFYKTIDERCAHNIAKLKFMEQGKAQHLIVRTPKLREQIAQAFLKERTVEEIAIAERIARLLDESDEISIPLGYNF